MNEVNIDEEPLLHKMTRAALGLVNVVSKQDITNNVAFSMGKIIPNGPLGEASLDEPMLCVIYGQYGKVIEMLAKGLKLNIPGKEGK